MRNGQHISERAHWRPDRLVTDSMILSEHYVKQAIRIGDTGDPETVNMFRGIINGLTFSAVLWVLILLPFLVL